MNDHVDVMLFNYRNGGRRPDESYAWDPLGATVAAAVPHLLVMNEAKLYANRGREALAVAADALRRHTGTVFVPLLGVSDHGPYPPAVFYQPAHLGLIQHHDKHPDNPRHERNLIVLRHLATGHVLRVMPIHFDFQSRLRRFLEAERIGWTAEPRVRHDRRRRLPLHLLRPERTECVFENHPRHKRFNKALRVPHDDPRYGQPLRPDTRALDRLYDGELLDVADLAHQQGLSSDLAFTPTVNHGVDGHGALRIDRVLVTEPLRHAVVGSSYRVHIPDGEPPSDHRAVSLRILPWQITYAA